ncbi:3-hydroxyisobutyrate dehydrogenase-like beta-hydroxyacid dehydrogenase [Kaistia hirudinis]|uniref:3-hydroxyisobutyrate dehydrogenase-like beta-hydroxyacid dehydrogenase n=1 Tax=Kaistia hirudinis TaxID=1293440 RepID=A0A840API5_9HYPH|nr:NAD(P)-dependent oxidoreductase [Kaistia hirudinis]MBB3931183.1 3-hydroxyisobutyrate dehydrogenase-like beta-hydroxyacid dehydrogenase [Kaistia hirudinis]
MRIGWIGLGKMGLPMSKRIAEAGNSVTVLARHSAGAARAEAAGYAHVGDMAALAAASDVIISAIPDDPALLQTVLGEAGLARHVRAGQVYIDTSTVSPEASARVAEQMAAGGVSYLRAPVSGSTATAAAGALTVMVSGPRDTYDRLLPLFEAFTRTRFYLGADEQARFMKLALNAMVGATSALLAEALTLSRRGGISLADALDVFGKSAVTSPLIEYKRAMILEGRYDPAFELSQMMKDFDIALDVGRAHHAPLPLTAQIRQQFEAAYLRGHGERDFFVLVRELAELAGLED